MYFFLYLYFYYVLCKKKYLMANQETRLIKSVFVDNLCWQDNSRHVENKHKSSSLSMSWTIGDEEVEVFDGCSGRLARVGRWAVFVASNPTDPTRNVLLLGSG